MDFVLTYTLGDWENTDTIRIYVNAIGAEPAVLQAWVNNPNIIKKILMSHGLTDENATYVIQKSLFFILNCANPDYELYLREELEKQKND